MLKVMIVEDEDIVRDDIKHLIDWKENGFNIIAEARNGGEGLRFFHDHNPDIIITDIKMPVMGGLEMISSIMQVRKSKKIILLTAYGDFDFAREAIKLGIHSYVLKHELDGSMLIQELNKLKHQMEEEESVGDLARKEQLRMFLKRIESQSGDVEPAGTDHLFRWQGRTGVLVLGFEPLPSDQEPQSFLNKGIDKKEFVDFLYTRSFQDIEAEAVDLNNNEYIIFYRIPERSSERSLFEFGAAFANQLQAAVSGAFPDTPLSIAVGPVFGHYRELRNSLKKTRELFSKRIFKKGNCILTHAQEPSNKEALQAAVELKLTEIHNYVASEQYAQVHGELDELFTRLLIELQDTAVLRSCILELIRSINQKGLARQGTPMIETFEALTEIQQLANVYQIAGWFKHILNLLEAETNSKYSKKIRELLQFIHDNYQKDISLNELADRLGFSLIYTSQLFKKEVGVSFVTYLTKYRMEKAKELLETGRYKVYEVSAMVGYQTVQYFCKTFKKVTGHNPGDL
ncbi:response regulator transcription factor [Paenibacillus piri]|uniref:Response regulator n=1 Tax=Paenibacillus piri TaxID=2547395 RepID=A0A4R5KT37_9BACL|nr:response regulator [Paenibacillus piri]TDF98037.1 response regulator [Paenibacillus piri]